MSWFLLYKRIRNSLYLQFLSKENKGNIPLLLTTLYILAWLKRFIKSMWHDYITIWLHFCRACFYYSQRRELLGKNVYRKIRERFDVVVAFKNSFLFSSNFYTFKIFLCGVYIFVHTPKIIRIDFHWPNQIWTNFKRTIDNEIDHPRWF